MTEYGRPKSLALGATIALAGLLIAIISAQNATALFPEILFYVIVIILIILIAILVVYDFLWQRTSRYVDTKLRERKWNSLARKNFDDFRSFVKEFTKLGEFTGESKGILLILESLLQEATGRYGILIDTRTKEFASVLRNSVLAFKQRLMQLHWKKREINYEFLQCLAKEFEGYISIHKQLYVDFTITMARQIGNETITQSTKSNYSDYKENYNQFIFAYTEFAKKCSKEQIGIFSEYLRKSEGW